MSHFYKRHKYRLHVMRPCSQQRLGVTVCKWNCRGLNNNLEIWIKEKWACNQTVLLGSQKNEFSVFKYWLNIKERSSAPNHFQKSILFQKLVMTDFRFFFLKLWFVMSQRNSGQKAVSSPLHAKAHTGLSVIQCSSSQLFSPSLLP